MGSARNPNRLAASDQRRRIITAKAWIKANAATVDAFPNLDLFVSGPWNILLNLYVSLHENALVDTKSACETSGAAQTTAFRYVGAMADAGLLIRFADPLDGRRTLLQLSQLGVDGVERAIDAALESDLELGLGRLVYFKDVERQL